VVVILWNYKARGIKLTDSLKPSSWWSFGVQIRNKMKTLVNIVSCSDCTQRDLFRTDKHGYQLVIGI
jgi:hypothetical protein